MTLTLADLQAGDRVSGWVWTGGESAGLVYTTVVRVNRKTVTVRYEDGHTQRIDPYHLNERLPS